MSPIIARRGLECEGCHSLDVHPAFLDDLSRGPGGSRASRSEDLGRLCADAFDPECFDMDDALLRALSPYVVEGTQLLMTTRSLR
jgi:hypothetical protein